jgi:L-ascorbate metabolism protein UlaG (beta-lactamase superfamily)
MQIKTILCLLSFLVFNTVIAQLAEADQIKADKGTIEIQPILHSSMVISYNDITIYVDPYGGASLYEGLEAPDIILITDIHGDHLHQETLDEIDLSKGLFVVPKAVADKLPEHIKNQVDILNNGQSIHRSDIFIQAIPMYNLPEDETSRHPKGRGNGYILTIENKRIYISGDTEDIQEMRNLQNIDIAFVCMNLPYTMAIDHAADAVLEFQPKIVYPFHYRGQGGLSDVEAFKNLVHSKNKNIEVRLKNWYPKN